MTYEFNSSATQSLPLRIIRARDCVVAPIRSIVAKSDLTEQQWRILNVLAEAGPMDATTLSEKASILLPSQTRILQTLTERGLVHREQQTVDRRKQSVEITPAGREIVEGHAEEMAALASRIEARLGPERLAELMAMLDDLREF